MKHATLNKREGRKNKGGTARRSQKREEGLARRILGRGGFTLIELLVVIAIMALLASVVLLRYPFTVERVEDSRVISNLSQFRTQAAILYADGGQKYNEVASCVIAAGDCQCSADSDLSALCRDAQKYSDENLIIFVNQNKQGYCVSAHLRDYDDYFCIDSSDHIKRYPAFPVNCISACQAGNNCACE